jgi:hypothetical protein
MIFRNSIGQQEAKILLNYNQGTTASYMRFSDIWADEWKSRLHIAIQLQSRLNKPQMNF